MLKRIALLGLTAALGLALAVPAFAANPMQMSVANVSAADNTALAGTVSARLYSISGGDIGINNGGTVACNNTRCPRTYGALGGFGAPGGYPGQTENTASYNTDADNQTMYVVWDGQVNAGACNHAAYYSVSGSVVSSTVLPSGRDFRQPGCVGTLSGNCFERDDTAKARTTPLLNVNMGYQSAHSLGSIGGLSPVPTVRVSAPGVGCPAGQVHLTWDAPESYAAAMNTNTPNNPPASPVKGVRLYSNASSCSQCPGGDAGWVAGASFDNGTTDTCVPVAGDTWYALTVRFRGPGNNANSEIESGIVGGTGFVGANSQCVGNPATASRITNLSARYAGRGSVNVNWTTGTEGGVQGFYVTRGTSAGGPYERVSELVAPRGDGQTYSVQNKVHSALGRVQYYSIEIVNADGTTEHSGPTAVNLPAAKKKFGTQ